MTYLKASLRVRRVALVSVFVFIAVPLLIVSACGPGWEPDVFVPSHQPHASTDYAKGQLGVLQPGYYIAEKIAAYRYLNGGTLNAAEQAQWSDASSWGLNHEGDVSMGVNAWVGARAEVAPALQLAEVKSIGQDQNFESGQGAAKLSITIFNCGNSAFTTAAATLRDRVKQWGAASANIKDWLAAQDAVFSNCTAKGMMPAAATADAPLLLRQDRAYQTAAAKFYAGDYDGAEKAFLVIAQEAASPWSRWGLYLSARCLVRKAAFAARMTGDPYSGTMASFDMPLLQAANARLQDAMAQAKDDSIRHAVQAEIDFVAVRLTPEKHLERVAVLLAGPRHDAEFGQHLVDLRFLLDHGSLSAPVANVPLVQWMSATGSSFKTEKTGAPETSLAHWKQNRSLPWLIAALQDSSSADAELVAAATKVPENSPAYVTAQFHRARLMLVANDLADARELTAHVLSVVKNDPASTNALLVLRMQTAGSLDTFLTDAPRTAVEINSEAANEVPCVNPKTITDCTSKIPALQFDSDAANAFNEKLPLALWVEAAKNPALPQNLRDAVSLAGWTRAVMMGDADLAKQFAPTLPPKLRQSVGESIGFAATLAILRAPGLRPYLQAGVQRSLTWYVRDSFRDNWWCQKPSSGGTVDGRTTPDLAAWKGLSFLTASHKEAATREGTALDASPNGALFVGRRAIDHVRTNAAEANAAETLALVVNATHYGCFRNDDEKTKSALSKEAFNLLHSRYGGTRWAAQTRYYY